MRHELDPTGQPVANTVDGDLRGTAVQAHTIHGGVHIYESPARLTASLPYRCGVVPPQTSFFRKRMAFPMGARAFSEATGSGATLGGAAQVSVLSGLGGVGKTQLAVDYAEQAWTSTEVELLVWVTAGSVDAIVSGYAHAAAALTGMEVPAPEHGAQRFMEWLASTSVRWLVVLDDLQSPADLSGLWPPSSPSGQVIITTRRADAALNGNSRQLIKVGEFTPAEAYSYLAAALADEPGLFDNQASALTRDLGYLPLAIAQAAAYLRDRKLTCARYRTRLSDRHRLLASLFPDHDGLPDQHQRTVAATWSLSIEQANRLDPAGVARPLLEIASVLDANGIPAEIFTAPAALGLLAAHTGRPADGDEAWDGLGCLQRLNLITWRPEAAPQAVRVHALVQRATRESLEHDCIGAVATATADAMLQSWPDVERDAALSQVLRANTDALSLATGEHLWTSGCHPVLFRAGCSLGEVGLFTEASSYFTALHNTAAQYLTPDHPDYLAARHDAAHWRGESGDPAGAAAECIDLSAEQLHVLGPDHPATLRTRSDLARWRGEAGDPTGAADAFKALLADQVRVLGPDHPATLETRSDLARWHGEIGGPSGVADAFESVLADQLRVLGPDHRDTFVTRSNYAWWRGATGDLTASIAAFEDLLVDRLRTLGPDHPKTLFTRNSLAYWRGTAGDSAGAVTALEVLLIDRLRVLGPEHNDTLTTRSCLSRFRGEAGDPIGALTACEELLADKLRLIGPDHPTTLITRSSVAWWRGEAGDPQGALAACEELLKDELRLLGPDHPLTLSTRGTLAWWRGEAGDPQGALAACEELLKDRLRVLGPDHPRTLTTRSSLARFRGEAGDPAGAVFAFESIIADKLRILGPDHPDSLETRRDLARWYREAGNPTRATTALECVIVDQIRVHGPEHPAVLVSQTLLNLFRPTAQP